MQTFMATLWPERVGHPEAGSDICLQIHVHHRIINQKHAKTAPSTLHLH
jgi:hypothetical protein